MGNSRRTVGLVLAAVVLAGLAGWGAWTLTDDGTSTSSQDQVPAPEAVPEGVTPDDPTVEKPVPLDDSTAGDAVPADQAEPDVPPPSPQASESSSRPDEAAPAPQVTPAGVTPDEPKVDAPVPLESVERTRSRANR